MRPRQPRLGVVLSVAVCLVGLAGCGGGQFGSELSARPKPEAVSASEGTVLRLPEKGVFSIALPKTSRESGLDGTAQADAGAENSGSANASAAVTEAGTASGNFQLGHAVSNASERQVDFAFTIRFHYAFDAAATPESGYPDAQVGLKLYARDGHGRLVRDLTIVQYSTENGPVSGDADARHEFTITLAPGESINVFAAGQVTVEIRAGRSAHGSLKLSDLHMEIATRPAPAVQPTTDEQK